MSCEMTVKNGEIKEIRGVIFDMDGVVFDSESVWKEGFLKANEHFGLGFDEEYRRSCCGKDEKMIRADLRAKYPDFNAGAYRDYIVEYAEHKFMTEGAPLKNGFTELADYLKTRGVKIALATSSTQKRAEALFRKNGLNSEEIFDAKVFACDVKIAKPDPAIFLLAAERIGEAPADCVVIEDAVNGIRAAAAGGFMPVFAVDLIEPDAYIEKNCVFIAKNLMSFRAILR